MIPSQVNAYFNPPANEVGTALVAESQYLDAGGIDRLSCGYFTASILLSAVVNFPSTITIRNNVLMPSMTGPTT